MVALQQHQKHEPVYLKKDKRHELFPAAPKGTNEDFFPAHRFPCLFRDMKYIYVAISYGPYGLSSALVP